MPIPPRVKKEILEDPFYDKCILTGKSKKLVKIDWHHVWSYGAKQINAKWAIVPVWSELHSPQGRDDAIHRCKETKEYVQWLTLNRVSLDWLSQMYPHKRWYIEYDYLNNKYKNYKFDYMAFEKKESKPSKIRYCSKCKLETPLFICPECNNYIEASSKKPKK